MGMAKRALEKSFARIHELDDLGITCEESGCEKDALFIVIDGLGEHMLVCEWYVDNEAQLCGNCENEVADSGEELPSGPDGQLTPFCNGCAEEFRK